MTNPANAKNQVIGVYQKDLVGKFARVLKLLGSGHVLVVHGMDGLDEISIGSETFVAELKEGRIIEYSVKPEDFGIGRSPLESIRAGNVEEAKKMLLDAIEGKPGPARDIVMVNAGASIYVAGLAESIMEGAGKAEMLISSGAAKAKLDELVAFTNALRAG